MTTIQFFLHSKDTDIFHHKESLTDFTKAEIDRCFQEYQDHGFVTIEEYYRNLTDYLKEFNRTSLGVDGKA